MAETRKPYIPKGFRNDEAGEKTSTVDDTSNTETTEPIGTWTFSCGMGHAVESWWPFKSCPVCMKKEPVWRTISA